MSDIRFLKNLKRKKYITYGLIIVLLILAFLIGRAYEENLILVNPNMNPTVKREENNRVTWMTYTTQEHNFSLSYPSTWYIDPKAGNGQFLLRRKGSKNTYLTFSYEPAKNPFIKQPNVTINRPWMVGNTPIQFTEYYTGLGEQTVAYANLRTAPLGGTLYNIVVRIDVNNTADSAMIVKRVLASYKTLK